MQSAPLTEAAFQTPYMKEDLPKPHICPIPFGLSILSVIFHSVLVVLDLDYKFTKAEHLCSLFGSVCYCFNLQLGSQSDIVYDS